MTILTSSVSETEAVGARLGKAIRECGRLLFVAMYGDLGAGKTAFVRGVASVLSAGSKVKSPTYTVVNEYRRGDTPLFHFDLYRIEDPRDLEGFGFYEYVKSGHCILEWSERLEDHLPEDAIRVTIRKCGEDCREITVEGIDLD